MNDGNKDVKKWYEKGWVLILFSIFLPLIGVVLILTNKHMQKKTKIILGVIVAIWTLVTFGMVWSDETVETETVITVTQSEPAKPDYSKQFKIFSKKTSSILPEDSKLETISLNDNVLVINKEFKMTGLEGSIENAFELNINVRFFNDMKYVKENFKDVPFDTLNYNYYYKSSDTNQYVKNGELIISKSKLLNFNFDSYNDRELLKLFEVKGQIDFKVLVKNYIAD